MFKSKLNIDFIFKLKTKLINNEKNIKNEYIKIVNISRVIFVFIIQLLYDNNVRLNSTLMQKFLILDSELDNQEKNEVKEKLLSHNKIREEVDTSKKINLRSLGLI